MIDVPYVKNEDIVECAEKFLEEHGDGTIPVDIERIADVKLGMDIIPTPELGKHIDGVGFITSDCKSIYVDESVYNSAPTRYRFTIAHELGHWYMHREQLAKCQFHSIEEWKAFYSSVDGGTHSKMEYQAYCFAGLILVPPRELSVEFDRCLADLAPNLARAKKAGVSRAACLGHAQAQLARAICRTFDVSHQVIDKRIGFDDLMSRIDY